jgi:hypothetical protein
MRCRTNSPTAVDQRSAALKIDISSREILRAMGNVHDQPVSKNVIDLVAGLMSEATDQLKVQGTYVIRNVVKMGSDVLELEGCPPLHGPVAGFLKPSTRVAIFVVTVGDAIDRVAEDRRLAGLEAESFVLHTIGSVAADAACDAMIEHLWANETRENEAVTAPFSPGFCGLPLKQQATLFSIVDGSAVGVSLLPSMMMKPLKSVSALAGIGPADQVDAQVVPCEHCVNDRCMARRSRR